VAVWFPETPIWNCGACRRDIPSDYIWRSRGSLFSQARRQRLRTLILRAYCPHCGIEQSLCVEGPWWRMRLFHLLWRLRYPHDDRGRLRLQTGSRRAMQRQKS
jgi:hypothetical protein